MSKIGEGREIEVTKTLKELTAGRRAPTIWLKTTFRIVLSNAIEALISPQRDARLSSFCWFSVATGGRSSRSCGSPKG